MRAADSVKLLLIAASLTLTHAKNFEYRLIQSNNIQRQELLLQKCDKYELDNNELYQNKSIHALSDADLEHLLIDRKHKFLYCYVPKVSSVLLFSPFVPPQSILPLRLTGGWAGRGRRRCQKPSWLCGN